MAFLLYEQAVANNTVKTVADLNRPANATGARIQASPHDVHYTMDGTTDPSITSGMVLQEGLPPEEFLIEDMIKIRFVQGLAGTCELNVHWFAGRDV